MPRNEELIQRQFGSDNPLPSIELAYNALKLGGIPANLYALKEDLNEGVVNLLGNIDEVLKELRDHEADDVRHLTAEQIAIINGAINATRALEIANKAIEDAKQGIIDEAVQKAFEKSNQYTDQEIKTALGELNLTSKDPETGEVVNQNLAETLAGTPQNVINPEYFYRFKNMIDNSSFEVFDGQTFKPYGWTGGVADDNASMFGTRSLKIARGQTAMQEAGHLINVAWLKTEAYNNTDDVIICFYHKFDQVVLKIYDIENNTYLPLTYVDSNLTETEMGDNVLFPAEDNWSRYRCMAKFTPKSNTTYIRIELTCDKGTNGACYIDGMSLEPYVTGEYPSIYKDGRYSMSAYQLLNPPPSDIDRFTPIEHLNIGTSEYDENGSIYYQELTRADGTLAIKREASNPDENGNYQTIVETFYRADGVTINYVDTYTYVYSSGGAIVSRDLSTTEVK